jgi:pimeloyl-ACP methyl ester carboxylesterase
MSEAEKFEDRFWESSDGLKLHCRDYPGNNSLTPVICVPGLTRNARDFANLPALLEQRNGGRRMIMADLRGRGESEWMNLIFRKVSSSEHRSEVSSRC